MQHKDIKVHGWLNSLVYYITSVKDWGSKLTKKAILNQNRNIVHIFQRIVYAKTFISD
jgi:hypothetical protein